MGECMPVEQQSFIDKIKTECLEKTNMTDQEAWSFGFRCWQLGYCKKGDILNSINNHLVMIKNDREFTSN